MKFYIIFPLLFYVFALEAQQTTLYGIVAIQNSRIETGKTQYVPNAAIEETNRRANATLTDAAGYFKLSLVGIPERERFQIIVRKEGMEVVNSDALYAISGQKDTVKIYMITSAKLADARQRYYKIGKTSAEAALEKQVKQIDAEYKRLKTNENANRERIAVLEREMQDLDAQRREVERVAKDFAERYARINLDEVGPQYQKAYLLLQEGKLDEALAALNQIGVEQRISTRVAERRRIGHATEDLAKQRIENERGLEQDMEALRFKADLLIAKFDYLAAEKTYEVLVNVDSTNIKALREKAEKNSMQGKLFAAAAYYKRIIELNKNERENAQTLNTLALLYVDQNRPALAEEAYMKAIGIQEKLSKTSPVLEFDISITYNHLGTFYRLQQNLEKARYYYSLSIDKREPLYKNFPQRYAADLGGVWMNMANLYKDLHWERLSVSAYKKSLSLYQEVVALNKSQQGEIAAIWYNLGNLYSDLGALDSANICYGAALETLQKTGTNQDWRLAQLNGQLHNSIATLANVQKDSIKAAQFFQKAIALQESMAIEFPMTIFERDLAATFNNMGNFYMDCQDWLNAERVILKSLEIRQRLAKANPNEYNELVLLTLGNLANMFDRKQDFVAAEKYLSGAIDLCESMISKDTILFGPRLSHLYAQRATHFQRRGQYVNAVNEIQRAIKLGEVLKRRKPQEFAFFTHGFWSHLSDFYDERNLFDSAAIAMLQNVNMLEAKFQADSFENTAKNLSIAMLRLGGIYDRAAKFEASGRFFQRGLAVMRPYAYRNARLYGQLYFDLHVFFAQSFQNRMAAEQNLQYRDQGLAILTKAGEFCMEKTKEFTPSRQSDDRFRSIRGAFINITKEVLPFEHLLWRSSLISFQPTEAAKLKYHLETISGWEDFYKKNPTSPDVAFRLATDYGGLAWSYIRNNKPKEAEDAAQKGLALDPGQTWIQINLAHALLLQNRYEEAKELYVYWSDQYDSAGSSFSSIYLKDFDELEKIGVTHQDIPRIRGLFKRK
jgi:tetratricopeptide (TPR) repeat protein